MGVEITTASAAVSLRGPTATGAARGENHAMFEARISRWLVAAAAFAVGLVTVAGGATAAFAEDAPAASSGQLEEITVTAERREETAQKVPNAISVVSAQELVDAGVNAQ